MIASDLGGSTRETIESAARIREKSSTVPIVLIVTNSCEDFAVAALKAGVNDYLKGHVTAQQLIESIRRLVPAGQSPSNCQLKTRMWIGDSEVSRSLLAYVSRLASTNSTVLITGETGTGKDLAAGLIHSMGGRSARPFVALNCAAIPDSLLESELFGRERGAYTGADTAYEGRLKMADGGTVFFDEIGDLTAYGQAKLLRVLESRQVQRLGSAADISLNIRILSATNQDLAAMIERGQFRRDLYYRLGVTRLDIPPLRARRDDIASLLMHFADGFSRELGIVFAGFSRRALQALTAFDWPGNVRQLRNVVEEIFVRLPAQPVDVEDLPPEITGERGRLPEVPSEEAEDEKSRILRMLKAAHWNKKRAAAQLKWSRMTLYRKMAMHHISGRKGVGGEPAPAEIKASA